MTIEQAIYQLEDLIKDRESFCYRDDFDEVFLQYIEACKAGIKALEKQVPKKIPAVNKIEMPYGTGKIVGIWRTICLPSYPPQYRYECSKCSVCSEKMSNYCPYCGAEMQFLEGEFIKKYEKVQLDVEIDEESEDDVE